MSKKLKATQDRVWLAGLGALAVAEQEGNDLFQQLVKRGRKVEEVYEVRHEKKLQGVLKAAVLRTTVKAEGKKEFFFRIRRIESGKGPQPPHSSPSADREAVASRQARRLASAKRAFLKEFASLANPETSEVFLRERKIFALSHRNTIYVPSFQFDEKGSPRPAVAKIIQILGKDTSDWGLALWFTAANRWLDGKRPVDLLKDASEEVIQAAEQEAAELVF